MRTNTPNPHYRELAAWAIENIPEAPGFYILHAETEIGSGEESGHLLGRAQHYSGSAANLRERFLAHIAGQGARLTEVYNERGLKYYMVRAFQTETVAEARAYEAYFKGRGPEGSRTKGNSRRCCPQCGGKKLPCPTK